MRPSAVDGNEHLGGQVVELRVKGAEPRGELRVEFHGGAAACLPHGGADIGLLGHWRKRIEASARLKLEEHVRFKPVAAKLVGQRRIALAIEGVRRNKRDPEASHGGEGEHDDPEASEHHGRYRFLR
jgi:hypothetical protein